MKESEKKFKRIAQRFVIPLIWISILLLCAAAILLACQVISGEASLLKRILLAASEVYIFAFICILLVSIIKYKEEMLLDDNERRRKWRFLNPQYKKFYRKMFYFEILFGAFLLISAAVMIFTNPKETVVWVMVIAGINLVILGIKDLRRWK